MCQNFRAADNTTERYKRKEYMTKEASPYIHSLAQQSEPRFLISAVGKRTFAPFRQGGRMKSEAGSAEIARSVARRRDITFPNQGASLTVLVTETVRQSVIFTTMGKMAV